MACRAPNRAAARCTSWNGWSWRIAPAARCARCRAASGAARKWRGRCWTRAALLLLDEANNGARHAEPRGSAQACARALRQPGLAVLWATHLIEEVPEAARVVMLAEGRVRAEGTVPEVLAQAAAADLPDAFARLTGARPELECDRLEVLNSPKDI